MNSKETVDVFPEPEEVDFTRFCRQEQDDSLTFLPNLLATYLAVYFDPIRFVGDGFMLFRDGVWDYMSSEGPLHNICVRALNNEARVDWIDDAILELEDLVYEEPPPGPLASTEGKIIIKPIITEDELLLLIRSLSSNTKRELARLLSPFLR